MGEETICTMRLKVVVPHRKERGHSNGRYHDWRSWSHPTRRSERRRTLSSEELGDEIRLLPGRQSHRHPVFDHCALDWIGGSGVVVAHTAAIGLPELICAHSSELYAATLLMRAYFIACIFAFYAMTADSLFLVLVGIVGLGFVLTLGSY